MPFPALTRWHAATKRTRLEKQFAGPWTIFLPSDIFSFFVEHPGKKCPCVTLCNKHLITLNLISNPASIIYHLLKSSTKSFLVTPFCVPSVPLRFVGLVAFGTVPTGLRGLGRLWLHLGLLRGLTKSQEWRQASHIYIYNMFITRISRLYILIYIIYK